MPFEPIAIVGQGCVLPGALSPEALWEAVVEGRDLLAPAPSGRWGIDRERVLAHKGEDTLDRATSDRGGYVRGFDEVFDPEGFALPAELVGSLDPVYRWTLHAAREALRDARYGGDLGRVAAIFGNLGFPSAGMARYAARAWLGDDAELFDLAPAAPHER
ncbi:MAG: hypothetical protein H5U40_17070, partial [Polyangiaceae bacterium]|nr:hypothetical protein [Polyangiaceae bacterium]